MAQAIAHRGPDDHGSWASAEVGLAYRRLAVIDLTPLGNQPMMSHDGRYVMVYNGELYNYVELRRELESAGVAFRGRSDSEVLLAAFSYWGEACISRFNGMWSFAIWDTIRRRLFASRDRFGKKPFFYHSSGAGFAFASEIKGLLAARQFRPMPDLQSIADFAAERVTDHSERTFFEGVKQLPPAHHLTWENGNLDVREFWRPDPSLVETDRSEVHGEEIRALLTDAVQIRLRADTPIGFLLSGGIDSAAVTCIAAAVSESELSLFSTVDAQDPVAEARGIDHVAAVYPSVRIYRDAPDCASFLADLEDCLWHQEEPFADGSMVAHFRLIRLARQTGTKVLLTGQGADETFAGYPGFFAVYLARLIQSGRVHEAMRFVSDIHRAGGRPLPPAVFAYLLPSRWRTAFRSRRSQSQIDWLSPEARVISPHVSHGLAYRRVDTLRTALVDCIRVRTLPGFLHYDDRNSMAHGVETRLPFLDYRLVERIINAPAGKLLNGGRTKALLRDAMKGIVPEPIVNRFTKQGYPAPIERWLRQAGAERWADWLSAVTACPLILEASWRGHQRAFLAGDDRRFSKVWRGLALALWYRRFISHAS